MHVDTHEPDTLPDEDEGDSLLGINVSISEPDGAWRNASVMLPVDDLTPDAIAEALVQCCIGVAAARSPQTLIALQSRLMAWGRD